MDAMKFDKLLKKPLMTLTRMITKAVQQYSFTQDAFDFLIRKISRIQNDVANIGNFGDGYD